MLENGGVAKLDAAWNLFPREWQLFAGDFGKIASLQNPKQSEAVDRRGTEGCVALVARLGLLDLLVVFFEFG